MQGGQGACREGSAPRRLAGRAAIAACAISCPSTSPGQRARRLKAPTNSRRVRLSAQSSASCDRKRSLFARPPSAMASQRRLLCRAATALVLALYVVRVAVLSAGCKLRVVCMYTPIGLALCAEGLELCRRASNAAEQLTKIHGRRLPPACRRRVPPPPIPRACRPGACGKSAGREQAPPRQPAGLLACLAQELNQMRARRLRPGASIRCKLRRPPSPSPLAAAWSRPEKARRCRRSSSRLILSQY